MCFTVTPSTDDLLEGNELFRLRLNPAGVRITYNPETADFTIIDEGMDISFTPYHTHHITEKFGER